jgi:two-component system, OmpR family, sensor kinase
VSPVSSTRSVGRGTSSVPTRSPLALWRRLPIRWRLSGGSAILTLTILCAFAAAVGLLATRQISTDFRDQVRRAADDMARKLRVNLDFRHGKATCSGVDLQDYGSAERAAVRVVLRGQIICGERAVDLGVPRGDAVEVGGRRVESREVPLAVNGNPSLGFAIAQYARPLSDVRHTMREVWILLGLGVLGGAALALLAGLAVARRAMGPIASLTETAREIGRTRDPGRRIDVPDGSDEVAELARTLDGMLQALDAERAETEAALGRQRRFVADASHELRTPLTSVLANLELLAVELEGEPQEAAASALRSARRMRRLVGDLLLLARADAGRVAPRESVDLAEVIVEAAGEAGPLAEGHGVEVDAPAPVPVEGTRDELHRLALNLLENALAHTPPGTQVRIEARRDGDDAALVAVEDDGPGVPAELAPRIFDRFVRGAGDAGGGTGLGLAIVRAVAESHGGAVRLAPPVDGRGARFEVRLPAAPAPRPAPELSPLGP